MDLSPGQARRLEIGPLRLWIRRTEYEWRMAWADQEIAGEPPDDADQGRWAATAGATQLRLLPVPPDRPLVVRPSTSFFIPPGVSVQIYVRVPVWLRVLTEDEVPLTEVPTLPLSNTWFGEPDAGELAWALKTDALHAADEVPAAPHEALCRVDIHHKGQAQLELNRLFLRAAHLKLYQGEGRLWTSAVSAVYEGGDRVGSVDYLSDPPVEAGDATLLCDAREPVAGTLVRARAGLLKSLELDKLRWGGD